LVKKFALLVVICSLAILTALAGCQQAGEDNGKPEKINEKNEVHREQKNGEKENNDKEELVDIEETVQEETDTKVKTGDFVQFGTYYDAPVLWRVIDIDNDGDLMLFAHKLISRKPFDAPGDYHDEERRKERGSNYWKDSNIRQWLNSKEKDIDWIQNEPSEEVLQEVSVRSLSSLSYSGESGFLSDDNFTEKEREAIKPREHKVLLFETDKHKKDGGSEQHEIDFDGNGRIPPVKNFDDAYYQMVEDSVFLLSLQELKELVYDRGMKYRAKATEELVNKHPDKYPEDLDKLRYGSYYLRTPEHDSSVGVFSLREVCEPLILHNSVTSSITHIRPALKLDLSRGIIESGSGEKDDPFVVARCNVPPCQDTNSKRHLRCTKFAKKLCKLMLEQSLFVA